MDETMEARLRAAETEAESLRTRLVYLEKMNAMLIAKMRIVERLAHSLANEVKWS